MLATGYEADRQFNATNGHRRLLFYDVANQRQVDVFVGSFEMCHEIPITERILLAEHGIPLAELLLTKLQIVAAERQGSDRHPDACSTTTTSPTRPGHDQRLASGRAVCSRLGALADHQDERRASARGATPLWPR